MKKLLIFLLLFAFGFGAYCGTVQYTFVNNQAVPGNDTNYFCWKPLSLPVGSYDIKVISTSGSASCEFEVCGGTVYTPAPRYKCGNLTVGSTRTINVTTAVDFIWWGWAWSTGTITLEISGANVATKPTITSATSVSAKAGDSFSYKITATGDTPIYYTVGTVPALPAYLSFNGTDTISGTLPYSSSSYSFTFDVTAANTASNDLKTVTVVVSAAGLPVWDNPIEITKNVGDQLSVQVSPEWVAGAPVIDVSVGSGSLPSFLELTSNDVLQGTCTTPGIYNFNLSATNPYGASNRDIKLTVNGSSPQYIGPIPCIINVTRGLQFAYDLKASMWTGADNVTISGLPAWASISNSMLSGVVPGDETRQNITGMVMTATNNFGPSNVNGVEIHITGIGDSLYFTSPSTAQGTIGQPFTYNATVNQPSGVSYSMSNAPAWLSCSSSGSVTGTVPEGITGFSFVITATHTELGSKSLTVNCTAVVSGEEGIAKHVIVDNFSDFGSTQWATDMAGFLANSYQEFSYIKTGVNAISNKMEFTNNNLEGIKFGTDSINSKLDVVNGNLFTIDETIKLVDTHVISGFNEVTDLLNDIKSKMNGNVSISTDGLDLPTYEFDTDFGEFTEAYTSTEIETKTELSQFSFVKGELNDLLAVPPSDVVLSVPLTGLGVGFTENPTLNVSNDSTVAPYVSFIRRFFDIVIWVVGCCWWVSIIAGFFV